MGEEPDKKLKDLVDAFKKDLKAKAGPSEIKNDSKVPLGILVDSAVAGGKKRILVLNPGEDTTTLPRGSDVDAVFTLHTLREKDGKFSFSDGESALKVPDGRKITIKDVTNKDGKLTISYSDQTTNAISPPVEKVPLKTFGVVMTIGADDLKEIDEKFSAKLKQSERLSELVKGNMEQMNKLGLKEGSYLKSITFAPVASASQKEPDKSPNVPKR